MAAIIIVSSGRSVMAQTQIMSDLMRGRLRDVRLLTRQIIRINPRGPVSRVSGSSENTQVCNTARVRGRILCSVRIRAARDQCMRRARRETRRPLCGYINIKWRIVLRHSLPDAPDRELFRITKGAVIRSEEHTSEL